MSRLRVVVCGLAVSLVWSVLPSVAQTTAAQPAFAPVAPSERIPNLDRLKQELKEYHECTCKCGCYAKDLDLQADRALAFLRQRAAHRAAHEKPALVLDIDETTLSNYPEMLKADFEYSGKAFAEWVDSASAAAIPGTLRLYNEAQKLGVSVFFLTGRPDTQRAATERNLRGQGFAGWKELIMRSPEQGSLTALEYKSAEREKIEGQGYRIVLNVGDQWSDLRGKPEAEYSVKYPDPYYFIK
ncbi:MAG TPA: HAD family acid phosphatase [Terracidiphilus sp.]|nr:HAD family acid phosphatase [Terracidiphilus sp.]